MVAGNFVFGQTDLSSNVLDTRNKLESEIQKNLADLIATRLDRSTFTVAVRLKVKEVPPAKKEDKPKEKVDELPAGMGIGVIDVRELVASYERKIEEIKLMKESLDKENQLPKYSASQIEINVALDENTYDQKYTDEFKAWLIKKMKSDYGPSTKSEVNRYKFVTPKTKENSQDPNQNKQDDQFKLKDLINLVPAALLLLGLLLLGYFVRQGLKENGSIKKDLALEQKNDWKLTRAEFKEDLEKALEESPEQIPEPVQRISARDLEHILGKIAFVCIELKGKVNELVRVWIDSGENGFVKSALLIDSMLAANEKIMTTTGAMPALLIPLDPDIAMSHEESLAEVYRQISKMNDYDKLLKLEEIYWDLVSIKTLGIQSLRRPFDFLQSLNEHALKELLDTQSQKSRALALMYLPPERKLGYLNQIENEQKEQVVLEMLTNSQISQKQIWDMDTSLKVNVINQSSNQEEKLVNLFPRTIETLQTLDALAEINILKKVVVGLPDEGLLLKQQFATLAFLNEWKSEFVKRLISTCTGSEIVALIRVLPDAKEVILSSCSEKVQLIVNDDLNLPDKQDELEKIKIISNIKSKWMKIIANENIPMSRVLVNKEKLEVLKNAS